jgi:hypothetical protein
MTDPRKPFFDAARKVAPLDGDDVEKIHAALDAAGVPRAAALPTPPPFEREAFLERFVNKSAPKLTSADIEFAAATLQVPARNLRAVIDVESGGQSFGPEGRPIILFEPHIFHRRTDGRWSPSSFSYAKWRERPYPKAQLARWEQMADAAARSEQAALESASWGLFQIMGFHWKALGYAGAESFGLAMAKGEAAQLGALVTFIKINGLADELRAGSSNSDSWRAFARGYNGEGYAANGYHEKLARAVKA